MRIIQPARKHGIADADMIHAVKNTIAIFPQPAQQEHHHPMSMHIGPARNGQLLEIGIIDINDQEIIAHAMPHRARRFKLNR